MNFGQFVNLTALKVTPEIVIIMAILLICILAIKKGIKVLGRWAEYAIVFPYYAIIFEMFLPTILLIVAEIRKKKLKTN
jgi:hypothetical protein